MNFRPLLPLLLILATSLVISCSTTSQSPPIILKAEVRFLADQQELSADVQLFQGDSFSVSRPFVPQPGSVTFLGSMMEQRRLRGDNYFRSVRKVQLPSELTFSFPPDSLTVASRSTVAFQMPSLSVADLPALMSKGAKRTNFSIGGEALREKESLIVFFEPQDRGERPRRIVVAGPSKTATISIPVAALESVPNGKYSVYLVRQGIVAEQTSSVHHSITYQYHSASGTVTVAE